MKGKRPPETGALLLAIAFPSLLTWIYFRALAGLPPAAAQSVYAAGKLLQFGFPVVWAMIVCGERLRPRRPDWKGVGEGAAFGALVLAAALILYYVFLAPSGFFAGPDEQIRAKVVGLGLDRLWKYAAVGVFYSLCHSFLEEYYWRWFVFGRLRRRQSFAKAAVLSSLGFMAHHVILLTTFFGAASPAAYLFSLAVAAGGFAWAWIYQRSGSLVGPWISHLLVDAGIFLIGFELARDLLT